MVFLLSFAVIMLPLLIASRFRLLHGVGGRLYKLWALIVFTFAGFRVKKYSQSSASFSGPVVYVANHSSYFDIPLLYFCLEHSICFMGKEELAKIPVFGAIFRSMHISVNRSSPKSRAKSLEKAKDMLQRGRSVVIFPEGTIQASIQPGLLPFKDGAFVLAMQAGVPVVPLCIPFNWQFLPDDGSIFPHYRPLAIHRLPPVFVQNHTPDYVPMLKQSVRNAIEEVLLRENDVWSGQS
jgi:1-acyl-sn-glycerol-3-phosphate acyltransferase